MSEFISSCQNFEEQRAIEAAAQIGCTALEIVDTVYGSGFPAWEPGYQELSFHNGYHGRMVGADGANVAVALGLAPRTVEITRTSGKSHDLNQLDGRGIDESKSADWLVTQMEAYKVFSAKEREMGRLAITGTQPLFDEQFRLVGQKATEQEYPSKEAEKVALSVACGDLGVLYKPQGPFMGHQLYREIQGMPPADELPLDKLVSFQEGQVHLVNTYSYPLIEAERILATHRSEVTAYSEKVLDQLQRGEITSWQQLLDQDAAFMRQYS